MTHTTLRQIGSPRPTVLTVGFFDGVHRGHQAILDRVVAGSKRLDARSAVVTFDPHPRTVLTGSPVPLLSTLHEKSALLTSAGIDLVLVLSFDHALADLSPREFVSDILIDRIGAVHVVVGYDHSVGKGAAGNAATIAGLGEELGFTTEIVLPKSGDHGAFSSSQIRIAIEEVGDMNSANAQLGRPYRLTGTVVHGDGRGRQLGFPTANLALDDPAKAIPANGVYAVKVLRGNGKAGYDGVMNIGVRPTLTSGLNRVLEVYLLDFDGDLYGESLGIAFVARIRNERKFDGIDDLKRQIQADIVDCIRIHESIS